MLKKQIRDLLGSYGQLQIANDLDTLSVNELQAFLAQLTAYAPLLKEQQRVLKSPPSSFQLKPLQSFQKSGNHSHQTHGKTLLSQGKVGCLILAGGQGTRLSLGKPKALTPLTLIKHKSLLQFFCEKTLAASYQARASLPLAIMTSPLNYTEIKSHLEEHHFFGLNPSQVSLFSQDMLPFLDDNGCWLLESSNKLLVGPDGNGHSLKLFVKSGVCQKWKEQGIEYVNMIPIDNPLADPFDAELVGSLAKSQSDICVKAMMRETPDEKVGILGLHNETICIQEYTEMPEDSSSFMIGNPGLFSFTLNFAQKIASYDLPLHLARKKAVVFSKNKQETLLIWKFERFILDIFPYSTKTEVIVYPREDIYAPIKNASGDKSLATSQKALLEFDKRTYEKISGLKAPEKDFELSPCFYYPSAELIQKWKGKAFPSEDYLT